MEMDPRLKAILNKRKPYKRPSKSADDSQAAAGPSSTAATTTSASDNAGAKPKPKKTVNNRKKRQQEFEALKARLQEKLHLAAVAAAAEQREQEEREAVANLEGAANGEAEMPIKGTDKTENSKNKSKRRTKKTNNGSKNKNKKLKPDNKNKTKGEGKKESGAHHEVSKDNPDLSCVTKDLQKPSDLATALERMRIRESTSKDPADAAMTRKVVYRHRLNPPAYTSALNYVDSDTGKLIPEKMAEMGNKDRCRIYADFLVPRLMEVHPTSYDFIMDKMYQMPDDMVVQMVYNDYILGEFASTCVHQLQKIAKATKRRRPSP